MYNLILVPFVISGATAYIRRAELTWSLLQVTSRSRSRRGRGLAGWSDLARMCAVSCNCCERALTSSSWSGSLSWRPRSPWRRQRRFIATARSNAATRKQPTQTADVTYTDTPTRDVITPCATAWCRTVTMSDAVAERGGVPWSTAVMSRRYGRAVSVCWNSCVTLRSPVCLSSWNARPRSVCLFVCLSV